MAKAMTSDRRMVEVDTTWMQENAIYLDYVQAKDGFWVPKCDLVQYELVNQQKEITMAKFTYYPDAVVVNDGLINQWIEEAIKTLTTTDREHTTLSSGDTLVLAFWVGSSLHVEVYNKSGIAFLHLYDEDLASGCPFEPYRRPRNNS